MFHVGRALGVFVVCRTDDMVVGCPHRPAVYRPYAVYMTLGSSQRAPSRKPVPPNSISGSYHVWVCGSEGRTGGRTDERTEGQSLRLSGGFTPCRHLRPSSGREHAIQSGDDDYLMKERN